MQSFDFIEIGSGVAGLTFALKAAEHGRVAIITKRAPADSNTAWAQGGVACVWSSEDSFESHVQDTLEAGAGLCDEEAVRTIVSDGPTRIRELIALIPPDAKSNARSSPPSRRTRKSLSCSVTWPST